MSPLSKLGMDPTSQERGITARYFVQHFGVRSGLAINGILEGFLIFLFLAITGVISASLFEGPELIVLNLFCYAFACAYIIIIAKQNFEVGRRNREIALALP
jgi:hypothetical protein